MEHFKFSDLYNETYQSFRPVIKKKNFLMNNNAIEKIQSENDELEKIIEQKKAVKEMLVDVLPKIKKQLENCTEIKNKYCDWCENLIKHKCSLLSFDENLDLQNKAIQSVLKGIQEQIIDLKNEADRENSLIYQKAKELNKKEDSLKKWCWVPGYNIALLSDYENALKQYQQRYADTKKRINDLQDQMEEKENEICSKSTLSNSANKLLQIYQNENKEITQRINQLSKMVAQWNQFYDFFIKLKSDLQTIDNVQTILDLAEEQFLEARQMEESIDYKKFEIHETFEGKYEIKTYDENYTIMYGSNNLAIFRSNICLREIPWCYLIQQRFFEIITLSDYKSIILDDKNNILTYNYKQNQGIRFESIEIQNNKVKCNQSVFIMKVQDNPAMYKLMNCDNNSEFCLDITNGNYTDNSALQMIEPNNTNNQKFVIKEIH